MPKKSTKKLDVTLEDRFEFLSEQSYIQYLMINATVKMLIEKGVIDQEALAKEMDTLNNGIRNMTESMVKEGSKPEEVEEIKEEE
jgi:hypothetical protein